MRAASPSTPRHLRRRGTGVATGLYSQHKQESPGGLPDRKKHFDPHVLWYEPSKPLRMRSATAKKRAVKYRIICGFFNLS